MLDDDEALVLHVVVVLSQSGIEELDQLNTGLIVRYSQSGYLPEHVSWGGGVVW